MSELRCISIVELVKEEGEKYRAKLASRRWGPWKLLISKPASLQMAHRQPGQGYWVNLEECTTSAYVLDWILQVSNKHWATPEVIYHLVEAIRDLLDPQATLCSGGQHKTLPDPGTRIRMLVRKSKKTTEGGK